MSYYVRERWESFHDASLGWNYLFAFTQADNHEGIAKLFADDADWAALDADDVSPQTAIPEQKRNAPIPKLMPVDFDLHKLPRRQFVLGNRFMSGVVTLGVGPPGAAKSTLAILAALSIATGERLSGEVVHRPGRVWIHNNEDSLDELYRRIGGMLKYHDIEFTRVRENIFVTSGLLERLIVAVKEKDVVKMQQAVSEMIASIRREGINHIVVDPFVSTHRGVSENSNEEMEQVINCFRIIAHETGCSIDLIHHASKQTETPGNMNAARGASSLIGAVRMVYTLTPMSKKMAEEINKGLTDDMKVSDDQVARLVRLDHAKGNYSPRDTRVSWFELESSGTPLRPTTSSPTVTRSRCRSPGRRRMGRPRASEDKISKLNDGTCCSAFAILSWRRCRRISACSEKSCPRSSGNSRCRIPVRASC